MTKSVHHVIDFTEVGAPLLLAGQRRASAHAGERRRGRPARRQEFCRGVQHRRPVAIIGLISASGTGDGRDRRGSRRCFQVSGYVQ